MIYVVLDQRVTLETVLTVAGVDTTVDIPRTSPSCVIQQSLILMVSYYFLVL